MASSELYLKYSEMLKLYINVYDYLESKRLSHPFIPVINPPEFNAYSKRQRDCPLSDMVVVFLQNVGHDICISSGVAVLSAVLSGGVGVLDIRYTGNGYRKYIDDILAMVDRAVLKANDK